VTRYVRVEPKRSDEAAAAALAVAAGIGVGAFVFYLARTLLSKEDLRRGRDEDEPRAIGPGG